MKNRRKITFLCVSQLTDKRERVRQIREKSITKLHDSGHARILMKYLG